MFSPINVLSQLSGNAKNIRSNKFFVSSIIAIGFCLATIAALYIGSAPPASELKEGDIVTRTVYAPYDFDYPTTIDQEKTEKAREDLEAKALPVFDIDQSIQEEVFGRLDDFFAKIEEASKSSSFSDKKQKLEFLKSNVQNNIPDKDLSIFLEIEDIGRIKKVAKDAIENVFIIGIVSQGEKDKLIREKTKKILLRNQRFRMEKEVAPKDLVDEKEASKILRDTLERLLPREKIEREAVHDLLSTELISNARFNEEETNAIKEKARRDAVPIYKKETVKKNELVAEKGQRLTKDDIVKMTQIISIHAVVNRTAYISGLMILLVVLVVVAIIYLGIFDARLISIPKSVLLITINAFLAILASLIIVQSDIQVYFIPLAGVAMVLTLLLGAHSAFITTVTMSIFIGVITGGKIDLALMLFAGSVLGIYAVRGARKRSQIFLAGFAIAIANFLSLAGLGLLNNTAKDVMLQDGVYGMINGIISSALVIVMIPVFEYAFSLITNVTLLELSDLSNPLLKELTIKAPGTYHHSILVGNLAEEACNAIGANSLLARVGAYYHDIGKTEKAEYFVENEGSTNSKHEKLTPSMSALIITNHTKDGIELAKKHKLNNAIIDFVSQHHGTSLIYFFYQKALEKVQSENELQEEEFRYPGPRPQTKETAIVHLADSVEASSRMLSDPTPARIRGLVQKIINNKFIDGQLNECDLTLKDLNKISESFVRVLTGVFHTRLEYPDSKPKKKNVFKGKGK